MNHRTRYSRRHRRNPRLPKKFGIAEALGVSALALSDLFKMIYSGIAGFWRVTHSIHYDI